MKQLLLFFVFIITSHLSHGQDIPIPNGLQLIDWNQEDLDGDGLIDMAAVYESKLSEKAGDRQKELILYQWKGEKWVEWIRTREAILQPFGEQDPYRGIEITDHGFLSIRHAGKSSRIWHTVDEYQFIEGEFRLVRYTLTSLVLCETLQIIGLNLINGEGMVGIANVTCEEDKKQEVVKESEEFSMDILNISLADRYKNPIIYYTPKLKAELIFSPHLSLE